MLVELQKNCLGFKRQLIPELISKFMRKLLKILGLLLLISNLCKSQSANLVKYYAAINQAELFIIDNKYDSAVQQYNSSFISNTKPFAKDIYNALLCNCKVNDHKNAYRHMYKLAQLGYPVEKIKSQKVCADFWLSPYGTKAKNLNKNVKPIYDPAYRRLIYDMVYKDQQYRIIPGSYKVYGDTIYKIDKKNVDLFRKCIKKYGFPSEYKIGIDSSGVIDPIYKVIIFHQSTSDKQIYNFSADLRTAISRGELENHAGAEMIMRSDGVTLFDAWGLAEVQFDSISYKKNNNGNMDTITTKYRSGLGVYRCSDAEAIKYNREREKIMLDPIADYYKKIKAQAKQEDFRFLIPASESVFIANNYQTYLEFTKNLIVVKKTEE